MGVSPSTVFNVFSNVYLGTWKSLTFGFPRGTCRVGCESIGLGPTTTMGRLGLV